MHHACLWPCGCAVRCPTRRLAAGDGILPTDVGGDGGAVMNVIDRIIELREQTCNGAERHWKNIRRQERLAYISYLRSVASLEIAMTKKGIENYDDLAAADLLLAKKIEEEL